MPGSAPEFSRFVKLDEIESGAVRRPLEANASERQGLSARFGLISLDSLVADITVERAGAGPLVRVSGSLEASLNQSSIISLQPVRSHVLEEFSELFGPEGYRPEGDDEEMPEIFDDGGIDVGELVSQVLALALDPYPRTAEEAAPSITDGAGKDDGLRRPFAELGELLKKRK